jgi:tRNA G18 (ribose-2'-O)-methylase SpoU
MADIIEGRNPVLEALRSGRPLSKILFADVNRQQDPIAEIISRARTIGIPWNLSPEMR